MRLVTSDPDVYVANRISGGMWILLLLVPLFPVISPIILFLKISSVLILGFAFNSEMHPVVIIFAVISLVYTIVRLVKWAFYMTPPRIFIGVMSLWFAACYAYQGYSLSHKDAMWAMFAAFLGLILGKWFSRVLTSRFRHAGPHAN